MKFGLFSMNSYVCSYPANAVRIAQLAEAAGFESLWAGEHVVLPDPRTKVDPFVKTGGRAVVRATLLLFLPLYSLF